MKTNLLQVPLLLLAGFTLTFSSATRAQSLTTGGSHVVLPSPNTWNALNDGKADVDLYTGRLNYTIPLHVVKSRELEIPISVQYSTDGVKVDDLASDVGLGWQINAGGVIGRVMRGLPDEFDGPYTIQLGCTGAGCQPEVPAKGFLDANVGDYSDKDYFISASRSVDDRKRIVEFSNRTGDYVSLGSNPKVWDTEPDEFYFNFDRYSGKFVFDKNGAIQIVPHQNLLITKIITNNLYASNEAGVSMITSFQITDDRGIKYTFGNVNPTSKAQMTAIEVTKYSMYSKWFQLAYYFSGNGWYTEVTPPIYLNLFATTPALLLDNGVANYGIDQVENKQTFTSSWYLTKVESPNGDFINLEYKNEDIKYLTGKTHDVSQLNLDRFFNGETYIFSTDYYNDVPPAISATGHKYQGQRFTITTSKSTINSKKLLSITAASGEKATFQSTTVRPDLVGAKRLESITVLNSSNEWIKTYNFNYDLSISEEEQYRYEFKVLTTGGFLYPHEFMGNSGTTNNYWNYIYWAVPFEGDWLAMMTADHYRMFLSGITETFFGGTTRDLVSFEYNTDYILPARLSAKQDYYGYYNDNFAGHTLRNITYLDSWQTSVPLPVVFASLYTVNQALYMRPTGTNHNSVTEKAKAGVLKNIFNRNGSKISIEYGHNQGLRVSKISYFPDKNVASSEDINYVYNNPQPAGFDAKFSNVFPTKTINGGATRTSIYSSSVPVSQSLNKTKGGFVGYGTIEKVRTGLGKEIFEFSNPGSNPNTDYLRYDVYNSANGTAIQLNTCDCFPYAPKNNVDYQRGLLKKVTVKNQAGNTLKSDTYNYSINPSGYIPKIVYGLKPGKYVFDGFPIVTAAFYHYKTDWVYLDNVESKLYDQADPGNENKSAITTTHYHYYRPGESIPVSDLLARKVSITLPTGEKSITETKFPGDYIFTGSPTGSDAISISLLKSKKIESVPIESMSYLEKSNGGTTVKYLLGASLSKFKEFYTGKVFLWENYKLKAGIGSSFTTYPWSTINGSNIFSWTNESNFKLVGSINSYDTFGNPLTETGEDGIQRTYTWGYNSSLLTSLIQNAGTYQHQTSYVHKPLVGVNQATDPNLRNTKYTFDDFNLLKLVKDHDGNILNRYRYNYKGSAANTASISHTINTNNSVTFNATGYASGSQLTWNFGNGTIKENGAANETATYPTAGQYTVSLTVAHAEYAPTTITKVITILPALSIAITAPTPTNGSNRTVSCGNNPTTTCLVTAAGGPYTFKWEYNYSASGSSTWYSTGSNSSTLSFNLVGVNASSNQIRCKITDDSGNTRYSTNSLIIFYTCGTQPGPSDCQPGWTWNAQLGRCDPPQGHCGEGCFWSGLECVCQ